MKAKTSIKSTTIAVLVIIVAVGLVGLIAWQWRSGKTTERGPAPEKKFEVAANKLPEGFPQDIEFREGSEVIAGYNSYPPGLVQAVREIKSPGTIAENAAYYWGYFESKKWVMRALTNPKDKSQAAFVGTQGDKQIAVTIMTKPEFGTVTTISYLTPKLEEIK